MIKATNSCAVNAEKKVNGFMLSVPCSWSHTDVSEGFSIAFTGLGSSSRFPFFSFL